MKNNSFRIVENRRTTSPVVLAIYRVSLLARLLLETFLRRKFGRRYYSLRQALVLDLLLLAWFSFEWFKAQLFYRMNTTSLHPASDDLMNRYGSWVVFTVLFLLYAVIRKVGSLRSKGDTLAMGEHFSFFNKIKVLGQYLTPRFIETIGEPLLCLIVGAILYFLRQPIGMVIIVSSLLYSVSYICAYSFADDIISDTNDAEARNTIYNTALKDDKPQQENSVEDAF